MSIEVRDPFAKLSDYELDNLVIHLDAAGRNDDSYHVLELETSDGRNAWYEVKDRRGDAAGYRADVFRALARMGQISCNMPGVIGVGCRYALILASLNSLEQNIPPHVLACCVEKGLWLPSKAFEYAMRFELKEDFDSALSALTPFMPVPLLRRALDAAMPDVPGRLLAAAVEGGIWSADAALARALAAGEPARARALAALAPHLDEPLLERAIVATRLMRDDENRFMAIADLAPHLVRIGHTEDVLEAARFLHHSGWRTRLLVSVSAYLPAPRQNEVVEEALRIASDIEDQSERTAAFVHLAGSLCGPSFDKAIAATYAMLPQHTEPGRDCSADVLRARLTAPIDPAEALETTINIVNPLQRAEALDAITTHLPVHLLARALDASWHLVSVPRWMARDSDVPEVALSDAEDLQLQQARLVTRARIAARLPPVERDEVFKKIIAAIPQVSDAIHRSQAICGLAPYVPLAALEALLEATLACTSGSLRSEALEHLAPVLTEPLLRRTLAAIVAIGDEHERMATIGTLASDLSPDERETRIGEALAMAHASGSEASRARVLVGLAGFLKGPAIDSALDAAKSMQDLEARALALSALAAHLAEPLIEEALDAVCQIRGDRAKVDRLKELVPHLSEPTLTRAWDVADSIDDPWAKWDALNALAPYLPGPLVGRALKAADDLDIEPRAVATVLGELAKRLAILGHPEDALNVLRHASFDEQLAAMVFADLAPHLPSAEAKQILDMGLKSAREVPRPSERAKALCWVAAAMPSSAKKRILREAVAAVWTIQDKADWGWALGPLMSHIAPLRRERAVKKAFAAALCEADPQGRMDALVGLAPHFTPSLMAAALAAAQQLPAPEQRGRLLAALAPRLQDPAQTSALAAGWADLLYYFAIEERTDFLETLRALAGTLTALGGRAVLADMINGVFIVGRWWP